MSESQIIWERAPVLWYERAGCLGVLAWVVVISPTPEEVGQLQIPPCPCSRCRQEKR